MKWHINPDENHYCPVHPDNYGNHEDPNTKQYKPTNPNYKSN